jgi:hypothetical protein
VLLSNHVILLKAPVERRVSPDLDIAGTNYGQPEFGILDNSNVDRQLHQISREWELEDLRSPITVRLHGIAEWHGKMNQTLPVGYKVYGYLCAKQHAASQLNSNAVWVFLPRFAGVVFVRLSSQVAVVRVEMKTPRNNGHLYGVPGNREQEPHFKKVGRSRAREFFSLMIPELLWSSRHGFACFRSSRCKYMVRLRDLA